MEGSFLAVSPQDSGRDEGVDARDIDLAIFEDDLALGHSVDVGLAVPAEVRDGLVGRASQTTGKPLRLVVSPGEEDIDEPWELGRLRHARDFFEREPGPE